MKIVIPELSLVALVGPSGAGKSTFARKHFRPTEVLSSDYFRALISDDETNQGASKDAFETLHFVAAKRLQNRRLTVIDATNVQPEARKPLLEMARKYHYLTTAIVFDLPADFCHSRNQQRPDRSFGPHIVRGHVQHLQRSLRNLEREGFRDVHVLRSVEDVESVVIERQPLWTDKRSEKGPLDIIGDVHGCYDELLALLRLLGYVLPEGANAAEAGAICHHPEGRKVVFVGDLVDRGPRTPEVLKLAIGMVEAGRALCVMGNHDSKLLRKLRGSEVKIAHGLEASLAQLEPEPPEFKAKVVAFLDGLVSHYVLDSGRLVVAHAGLSADLQGRASSRVRSFAMYGDTTGETDEYGLPVRRNWAVDYRGKAIVVYGHTPVLSAEWLNHTINIDTGCVFGGRLTALRYPEKELVSVPAARAYAESARPLTAATGTTLQQQSDDVLDREDVSGKRLIETRLGGPVTLREEQSYAALEVMSRFAADPHWLIYLPPTMSPSETTSLPGLLEHPAEAFGYYRSRGVARVVCEEKHMGSRAVVVVCRDAEAARRRFGVAEANAGICYTRTGRRFFEEAGLEGGLLQSVRSALDAVNFWEKFQTDWACLDCELMPWSAKAQQLLREQYAATGSAARAALTETVTILEQGAALLPAVNSLLDRHRRRLDDATAYTEAYRRYCWPVQAITDFKLAPFHLLATEGAVHVDKTHVWHLEQLAEVCQAGRSVLLATPFRMVDLTDEVSQAQGIRWWEERIGGGGEGMVVKPLDFVVPATQREKVQPALKCRGREYLRIIYGPEYSEPEYLQRLRSRGLSLKRSLAWREFVLGLEALERFVRREPLRRVHECVFGVLALESEPVDPRL
jgi:protein phosphatase